MYAEKCYRIWQSNMPCQDTMLSPSSYPSTIFIFHTVIIVFSKESHPLDTASQKASLFVFVYNMPTYIARRNDIPGAARPSVLPSPLPLLREPSTPPLPTNRHMDQNMTPIEPPPNIPDHAAYLVRRSFSLIRNTPTPFQTPVISLSPHYRLHLPYEQRDRAWQCGARVRAWRDNE